MSAAADMKLIFITDSRQKSTVSNAQTPTIPVTPDQKISQPRPLPTVPVRHVSTNRGTATSSVGVATVPGAVVVRPEPEDCDTADSPVTRPALAADTPSRVGTVDAATMIAAR